MSTTIRSAGASLLLALLPLSGCTALRSPKLQPGTEEAHVYVLSTTCFGVLVHVAVLMQNVDGPCPNGWLAFGFGDTTFMSWSAPWKYAYVPVLLLHNAVAPTQGALERLPLHIELRDVPTRTERERLVAEKTKMQAIELTVDARRAREVVRWLEIGHVWSARSGIPGEQISEAWSGYSIYHNACGDFVAHALFLLGVDIDPDRYLPRWFCWFRAD